MKKFQGSYMESPRDTSQSACSPELSSGERAGEKAAEEYERSAALYRTNSAWHLNPPFRELFVLTHRGEKPHLTLCFPYEGTAIKNLFVLLAAGLTVAGLVVSCGGGRDGIE